MTTERSDTPYCSLLVVGRKAHGVASGDTTPPKSTPPTLGGAPAAAGSPLQRDPEALSLLYRRFLPVIYRFLHSRTESTTLAEDLTSDTFFAIMESLGMLRAQDELGFATWALGVARNKLAMHVRRVKSRPEVSLESADMVEPIAVAEEDDPLVVLTAREVFELLCA